MTTTHDSAPTRYRAAGWWRDATFLDDLRGAVRRQPRRAAVICRHADGRPTERVSYGELSRLVDRLAGALLELGVRRGDVVTLQLSNSWQFGALCLACSRAGAVPGPVPPTTHGAQLADLMRLTGSPVYVGQAEFGGFSFAELSAEVAAAVPTLRHRVLVGGAGITGVLDFDRDMIAADWQADHPPAELDALESGQDDPAQVVFGAGPSGGRTGVVHTHNTLYATNRAVADVLRLSPDEVTATDSASAHPAGYSWNFLLPLLLGGTSVQVDAADPDLMLEIIDKQRVTLFLGAPAFLAQLIEANRRNPRDLSALRTLVTGGGPVSPGLAEQARDVLGCRLYALWGTAETGCATITRPDDPPGRAAQSNGTAVPGMEVRIVAGDNGAAAGRLQVRGAGQCVGYFNRPAAYIAAHTTDGWFDTGELARADGYGGIRVTGPG